MQTKPDIKLTIYAVILLFFAAGIICTTSALIFPYPASAITTIITAAVFVTVSLYLILHRNFTLYRLENDMLIITSGIIFRRTVYLYLDRAVSVIRFRLISCSFCIVRTVGGSCVLFTDKIQIVQKR